MKYCTQFCTVEMFLRETCTISLIWPDKFCFNSQMDFRAKVDESCRTAEEFTKLYYESVDKKRHVSQYTVFQRVPNPSSVAIISKSNEIISMFYRSPANVPIVPRQWNNGMERQWNHRQRQHPEILTRTAHNRTFGDDNRRTANHR